MAINRRTMPLPAADLWETLADGYAYADWVVGTRTIREVDDAFPAPGSKLHYTIGRRPFRHDGHTVVLAAVPDHQIELEVSAWPVAGVHVGLTLAPVTGSSTEVTMTEQPSRGPAAVLHNPLTDLLFRLRNTLTLRRLEAVARRHSPPKPAGQR